MFKALYKPTEYRKFVLMTVSMVVMVPLLAFGLYEARILEPGSAMRLGIIGGAVVLIVLAALVKYKGRLVYGDEAPEPWSQLIFRGVRNGLAFYGAFTLLYSFGLRWDTPFKIIMFVFGALSVFILITLIRYKREKQAS